MATIHGAAKSGDLSAVQSALRRGADVNEPDRHGRPPVVIAAWHGHAQLVEHLLESGADVNAACHGGTGALSGESGTTALMMAAWTGRDDVVGVLLRFGADVRAQSVDGMTAFDLARSNGWAAVVSILQQFDVTT